MFKTQDQSEITGKFLCAKFFPENPSYIIPGGQSCPGNCPVPIVTGVTFEPLVGKILKSHIATKDLGCWQGQDVVFGTSLLSDSCDDASSPDVVEDNIFNGMY